MWPLLFGRTRSGRKGEATSAADLFLSNAEADYHEITVTGNISFDQGS